MSDENVEAAAGIRGFWETFNRHDWDAFSAVMDLERFRGTGEASGVEVDDHLFWAAELRRGKLYCISEYADRADALEAAGLSE